MKETYQNQTKEARQPRGGQFVELALHSSILISQDILSYKHRHSGRGGPYKGLLGANPHNFESTILSS